MAKLSVIIRFKNEARYMAAVLRAVRGQDCPHAVEVVAVDNASSDTSRGIAERWADTVLDIRDYRPGAALNRATEASTGDGVVILSAHAIPANRTWLHSLTAWLDNPNVLGTYGAQMHTLTSRFLDKRDLDIFSGLLPRTEEKDADFWNANSAFHRSHWEKEPFDESVIELEDHYWTKRHLADGDRWVRFEPAALIYHYGHELRNDREFLTPSHLTDEERIREAVDVLARDNQPWPAVMSAGLTLGSLCRSPAVHRAIPVLGGCLLKHDDFDVRWRVAAVLGRISDPECAEFLVHGLHDPSFYPRDESAWALARLGDLAVPAVFRAIPDLSPEALPFAGLALGISGNPEAQQRAVEIFRTALMSQDTSIVRDGLYFLGEVAAAGAGGDLAQDVAGHLRHSDAEVLRAAAWCWGSLAAIRNDQSPPGESDVVRLARRHPLETVRVEAVVALGKTARAQRSQHLVHEVLRSLRWDGCGRVRYGAMQSVRLAVTAGMDCPDEVVTHDDDTDFGVLFERDLILGRA